MEKWCPKKATEDELCIQFMNEYAQLEQMNQFKSDPFVFHVANERKCGISQRIRLSKMGVIPGISDYIVFLKGGRVAAIEFKRDEKEKKKFQGTQSDFRDVCLDRGIPHLLTCSVEEAIDFLKSL